MLLTDEYTNPDTEETMPTPEMLECIRNCQGCHSVCLRTVMHCLQMGGEHAAPGHIQLMLDCAEICQASANFMLRGSAFHTRTCALCAEICERCAQECERADDAQMKACAEGCRTCADSCRRMSGA